MRCCTPCTCSRRRRMSFVRRLQRRGRRAARALGRVAPLLAPPSGSLADTRRVHRLRRRRPSVGCHARRSRCGGRRRRRPRRASPAPPRRPAPCPRRRPPFVVLEFGASDVLSTAALPRRGAAAASDGRRRDGFVGRQVGAATGVAARRRRWQATRGRLPTVAAGVAGTPLAFAAGEMHTLARRRAPSAAADGVDAEPAAVVGGAGGGGAGRRALGASSSGRSTRCRVWPRRGARRAPRSTASRPTRRRTPSVLAAVPVRGESAPARPGVTVEAAGGWEARSIDAWLRQLASVPSHLLPPSPPSTSTSFTESFAAVRAASSGASVAGGEPAAVARPPSRAGRSRAWSPHAKGRAS